MPVFTVSNFGQRYPVAGALLTRLESDGLVDELIHYSPQEFTPSQKKMLVSPRTTGADLGASVPSLACHGRP